MRKALFVMLFMLVGHAFAASTETTIILEQAARVGVKINPDATARADSVTISYGSDHGISDIKDSATRQRALLIAALAFHGNIIAAQRLMAASERESWFKSDSSIPSFRRFIYEATDTDSEDEVSIAASAIINSAISDLSLSGNEATHRANAETMIKAAAYGDVIAENLGYRLISASNKKLADRVKTSANSTAAKVSALAKVKK